MIEHYDKEYKFAGDKLDKKTETKMQGFYDQEKFDEWRSTMESVFTKRLRRKQEKSEDDNYFTSKRASGESIPKFSRQSLELFEALD